MHPAVPDHVNMFALRTFTSCKSAMVMCACQAEAAQAEAQDQAAQEHQQLQQQDAQQQTDPQAGVQPQQEAAEQPQHAGDARRYHRASCLLVGFTRVTDSTRMRVVLQLTRA